MGPAAVYYSVLRVALPEADLNKDNLRVTPCLAVWGGSAANKDW